MILAEEDHGDDLECDVILQLERTHYSDNLLLFQPGVEQHPQ